MKRAAAPSETQFSQQEIEPDALVVHADFFRLTDDAKARLAKAKSQLKDAVSLALTIDQSKLDESLTQDGSRGQCRDSQGAGEPLCGHCAHYPVGKHRDPIRQYRHGLAASRGGVKVQHQCAAVLR